MIQGPFADLLDGGEPYIYTYDDVFLDLIISMGNVIYSVTAVSVFVQVVHLSCLRDPVQ